MRTKSLLSTKLLVCILCISFSCQARDKSNSQAPDQKKPLSYFNIYKGNTHAHTIFTWTHGAHREKSMGKLVDPTEFHPDFIVPGKTDWRDHQSISLNPDEYKNLQALPDNHFQLAMDNGYDFYAITDHSQEPTMQPVSVDNPVWKYTQKAADKYNQNGKFVALAGYEYSRNTDEGGGNGHINVINSAEYVNADYGQRGPVPAWPEANWTIPHFYNWVKTAKAHQNKGSVVVGFNHPGAKQYNDWDHIDDEIVKLISTFEIHSNHKNPRWEAYIRALNKGWKVSPIGVLDNHSINVLSNENRFPPTLVLAPELTREAITQAMKARRTYASWIKGVELKYAVNGNIMGSTIKKSKKYKFDIVLNTNPANPSDCIKRIQILKNDPEGKDDLVVVEEISFDNNESAINWKPVIKNSDAKFFLIRVFHESDKDKAGQFKKHGSTISAPVWIFSRGKWKNTKV
ncbi:MAG: DUF3604 domain-containing protein [Paludibacter sp.]|nr:DUF3604 domain-containing protein [Paludibacter sp.]